MTVLEDLSPCTCLPSFADHILAVGWLKSGRPFRTGPTPQTVYDRLRSFARNPWQPLISAEIHSCDLCQFEGEQSGVANLFFPYQSKIYVSPELITHYINAHHYQPPPIFCDAVLACPEMDSMEYKRLLITCNGRVLWNEASA
jgi:hypothetical protein